MVRVPELRRRPLNDRDPAPQGRYVLYWMIAARRTRWSFALDRAAEWCEGLGKPLLVFEPLRAGYPFACDRFHRFVLDGMADNQRACADAGVAHYPYVEPEPGAGRGLLAALASEACVVVTDDAPGFFYPRMLRAAAEQVPVLLEAVDGNGLLPLRAADRAFPTAHSFRRFLQKTLREHLVLPSAEPLRGLSGEARVPAAATKRWPPAAPELLAGGAEALAALPIDHAVPPAPL
ncbi:MAG: deoxyribodipyrimidine photolyase, partial [Deferrisomatales bacterium]